MNATIVYVNGRAWELGEGFEPGPPNKRGPKVGARKIIDSTRAAALEEARSLVMSGIPKIEAARQMKLKYVLDVTADTLARLI